MTTYSIFWRMPRSSERPPARLVWFNFAIEFRGRVNDNYLVRLVQPNGGLTTLTAQEGWLPAHPDNEPAKAAHAFTTNLYGTDEDDVEGELPSRFVLTTQTYTFPVRKIPSTAGHLWTHTVASTGVRKNHRRAYIEAKLRLRPVTLEVVDEPSGLTIRDFDLEYASQDE